MTTENMGNDMEGKQLSDEVLDDVVGGAIHHDSNGQWSVLNDKTSAVVKTFGTRAEAIAYAKMRGYGTNEI